MPFHVTKKISYNSKDGTSPPIYLIDFINLSISSTYPPDPPIYLSTYQTHPPHLFLLLLLDTWPVYCMFLLGICNACPILTIAN